MIRTPVTSSQIASIGYDLGTQTLEIEFKPFQKAGQEPRPNTVYQYQNVTPALHESLMGAESVGSFFRREIKPHADKYPYQKIS